MRCVQVMEFPVVMLVRFWANHHLLDLLQRPLWRVVKGRSRSYVDKILTGSLPSGSLLHSQSPGCRGLLKLLSLLSSDVLGSEAGLLTCSARTRPAS